MEATPINAVWVMLSVLLLSVILYYIIGPVIEYFIN